MAHSMAQSMEVQSIEDLLARIHEHEQVCKEYEQLCIEQANTLNNIISYLRSCGLTLYANNKIRVMRIIPRARKCRCSYTIISDVGMYHEIAARRFTQIPPVRLLAEPEDDTTYAMQLVEAIKCAKKHGLRITARFFKTPIADIAVGRRIIVKLESGEEKRYSINTFAALVKKGYLVLKF